MKVLGIYGSPRKGGNSDLLLDKILEGAASQGGEVSSLCVRDITISGCIGCGECDETGECVIRDGMTEVYPMFREADAIVLASPIYFYGLPAKAKALVDRSQAMWAARMLTKPPERRRVYDSGRGWLAAVGGTKGKNLFEGVELTARYFYDALDMSYEGGIFFRSIDEKGAILANPGAVAQAIDLGRRIVSGDEGRIPE